MFSALASTLAPVALAAFLSLADPLSYEYSGQTDAAGKAFVVVTVNRAVDDLELVLEGDGKTLRKSLGSVGSGEQAKLVWSQRSARASYQLAISGDGLEADFDFEIVKNSPSAGAGRLGKFKVHSRREDIVDRRMAVFETSFDLTSYTYEIYDTVGDVIEGQTVAEPVKAGERITVQWSSPREVFMVFLRGEDQFGRFAESKLVPWAVEIPHTEISFDSGKFDVKSDETAKLDEALAVAFHELVALEKVNRAVGANLTPKLFIVGYTDTVGRPGANRKLSRNRARAIGEYFRDGGFWAEIYFAGMGEQGLRVPTADNVDEARNRRALYLLGVKQPAAGGAIPARWTKLVGARSAPPGFKLPPLPERWARARQARIAPPEDGSMGEDPVGAELEAGSADGAPPSTPAAGDGAGAPAAEGGPPEVEGEPGAAARGCSVQPRRGSGAGTGAGLAFGWVLIGLAARRRRFRHLPT